MKSIHLLSLWLVLFAATTQLCLANDKYLTEEQEKDISEEEQIHIDNEMDRIREREEQEIEEDDEEEHDDILSPRMKVNKPSGGSPLIMSLVGMLENELGSDQTLRLLNNPKKIKTIFGLLEDMNGEILDQNGNAEFKFVIKDLKKQLMAHKGRMSYGRLTSITTWFLGWGLYMSQIPELWVPYVMELMQTMQAQICGDEACSQLILKYFS